jgi:hypothetical protein
MATNRCMKKLVSIIIGLLLVIGASAQTRLLSWSIPPDTNYTVQVFTSTNIIAPINTWPLYLSIIKPPTNVVVIAATNAQGFFTGKVIAYTNSVPWSSVTLAWDASLSGGVAGYNVYFGGNSHAYTNMVTAGNALSVQITGLRVGIYYFAATAYDSFGLESDFSSEVNWTNQIKLIATTNSLHLTLK